MINILWDSSHLWGYMALHALQATGLPFRVLRSANVAQAGVSGKILLAPGGSARGKAAALGPAGQGAIRRFVAEGGHYLGFCGGAGLALADGLGLCPWKRADLADRMQHLVSGHIRCELAQSSAWTPAGEEHALLPVWWPARFEEGPADQGVEVLARYEDAGPDLYVADLPFSSIPPTLRVEWRVKYGVELRPTLLDKQPCVIRGGFGRGDWVLSYSHLESPALPGFDTSRFFSHILGCWLGNDGEAVSVPEWYPSLLPVLWEDEVLLAAREGMERILTLAEALGLLFERRPWLRGWRSGVPGIQLNGLYVGLCTALSLEPNVGRLSLWQHNREEFGRRFSVFEQGALSWLLACRLSETMAETSSPVGLQALPKALLVDQKQKLFGAHLTGNGLCGELQDSLEALL